VGSHQARKQANQKIHQMNRRSYIILLLFLSWPVNNLFRFFKWPVRDNYRPFLLNDESVDPAWYAWHICGSLSYIVIFWAVWLYMNGNYKRDAGVLTIFGAIFFNQITDIIHYLCWQRHLEGFILFQGFVLLFAGIINLDRYLKQRNGAKR
jgi:hypothetical protein